MECPACGHENPLGARFCNECATPLTSACVSCGGENPPGAKFCSQCAAPLGEGPPSASDRDPRTYTPKHLADKILQSKSALEGERKQVTVLFADVKGSLELAEQVDAEEWHRILERFFEILTEGVHRFEGTVNQYTGDGIMALFGAPIAHEDHAQRACYAALHLRDVLRDHAQELRRQRGLDFQTRIGLNSGEVVVGKIGDDLRMDYTAQGQTVGLAQRMEQLAEAGRVYVSPQTASLVEGYFDLDDLGEFAVKGAAGPIRVHELRGVGSLRTRLDLSRSRGFSRFVGRADEMATLELALHRAQEGHGQVVGVVGAAGVGKSRLCLEFVERCRAQRIPVHEAHCPSHGSTVPFLVVLELLRDLLGVTERDAPLKVRETITGRCLVLDRELEPFLQLVFEFLGVADPARPALSLEPEVRQHRLFAFVRRLVGALGAREPTLILIDDLHWIDGASDAFLAQLVEAVGGSRALLLVNFRPEYRAAWTQRSHYQQLPLTPLGSEAVGELLRGLLGEHVSLAGLRERIEGRTGGNPFFVEEVVQSLIESGALEGAPGTYRLVTPVERIEVPGTVQAVLAARIDRLPERDKQVLQAAAVIGRRFSGPVLERVVECAEAELAGALAALQGAELVREEALYPVAEYAFRHPLTHQVTYESQLASRRARLHEAAARALEAVHADGLDEQAALLAHHWEQAGEALEAARWHLRAAERSAPTDPPAALHHHRRTRELVAGLGASPETDGMRIRACIGTIWGPGAMLDVSDDELDTAFAEARGQAERAGDSRSLAVVLTAYGLALPMRGRILEGVEWANEAVRVADRMGDRALRCAARCAPLYAHHRTGRLEEERVRAEEGIALAEGDPDLGSEFWRPGFSPLVMLWMSLGRALCDQGRLAQGFAALDRATELARERDQASALGNCLFWSVIAACVVEDLERATRALREHALIREQVVLPLTHVTYEGSRVRVHLARQEWREAIRSEVAHRNPGVLVRAYLGIGDHARARAVAEGAVSEAGASGARLFEVSCSLQLAQVLRTIDAARESGRIEALLKRGEDLVRETGARLSLPSLHEERARLAQALGDPTKAEHHLREAHRLWTEMDAPFPAARLARELGLSA